MTDPRPSTREQHKLIADALIDLGFTSRASRLGALSVWANRPIDAFAALTHAEAAAVILRASRELAIRAGDDA